jgi:hypothetical protein
MVGKSLLLGLQRRYNMSGGGGKGASQETKPDKVTLQMISELFNYGKEVGKIPYQPWTGLDVAAFTPQQQAGMQQFADMGNSFGMKSPTNVMAGLPQAQVDASGVTGYSGYPAFAQNLAANAATPAAQRYAEFFKLPVEALYGDPSSGLNPSLKVAGGANGGFTAGTTPQTMNNPTGINQAATTSTAAPANKNGIPQLTLGSKGPEEMNKIMTGSGSGHIDVGKGSKGSGGSANDMIRNVVGVL